VNRSNDTFNVFFANDDRGKSCPYQFFYHKDFFLVFLHERTF
jgi:hypothetical protein